MSSKRYFSMSLLAEASYANILDTNNDLEKEPELIVKRLINEETDGSRDFSPTQAAQFIDTATGYTVLSQSPYPGPPAGDGFSATLFQNNATGEKTLAIRGSDDAFDYITDVIDVAVLGSTGLQSQYQTLKAYYDLLVSEGQLDTNETFSVAGHSLGGFLAQAFSLDYFGKVTETYTYNAPGFSTDSSEVLTALGISGNTSVAGITNLYGEQGLELTAGLGQLIGASEPIFIEDQPGLTGGVKNHSIKLLTNSLAVYELLESVDATLSTNDITRLLEQVSDKPQTSLEEVLNVMGGLTGAGTVTGVDDREQFYTSLESIRRHLFENTAVENPVLNANYRNMKLVDVNSLADDATLDTSEGLAYRYALENLNTFAITGGTGLYATHNAQGELAAVNFTGQYLQDRADMLDLKIRLAAQDKSLLVNSAADIRYEDPDVTLQQYSITPGRSATARRVVFGSGGADLLAGDSRVDHIYGQDGDDQLSGKGGDDYLEGGIGKDSYRFASGDGFDTIFDQDGNGSITYDGIVLDGGEQLPGNASVWQSTDENFTYTLDATTLTIAGPDGKIQVNDFQDGELGITLNAANPPQPSGYTPVILTDNADSYLGSHTREEIQALGGDDSIITSSQTSQIVHAGDGNDYVIESGSDLSDDVFFGEQGHDALIGGAGNDELYGGSEDDFLTGGDDNDYLAGDSGNDVLSGGGGTDYLSGGVGNDDLWGDGTFQAADVRWTASRTGATLQDSGVLYGGISGGDQSFSDGADVIFGGAGNDLISGAGGNDLLYGESDSDFIQGGQGDDYIDGGDQDDVLIGDYRSGAGSDDTDNIGSDTLRGGSGSDILEGGYGDDHLYGGSGNDQLIGDFDVHPERAGDDILEGGPGDDQLDGGLGDDRLSGGSGNDVLDGGKGDDILEGGSGDDVYLYNLGDGSDLVLDREGVNRVRFGAGITADALALTFQDDALRIQISADDTLQLDTRSTGIDVYEFSDGTSLTHAQLLTQVPSVTLIDGSDADDVLIGTAGEDHISAGDGNDRIIAGGGNDLLTGGNGDDTFVYNAGDGSDTIQQPAASGSDRLVYGNGITGSDLQLSGDEQHLDIAVAASGETIHVENFFESGNSLMSMEFADGAVWNIDDIRNRTDLDLGNSSGVVSGYGGNDTISGGRGDDILYGNGGNDDLFGWFGDDTLVGGAGNDTLAGYAGKNTYLFGRGDGQDEIRITDPDSQSLPFGNIVQDTLRLGAGITPADIKLTRTPADLLLTISDTGDSVLFKSLFNGWTGGANDGFAAIEFDDGSRWDIDYVTRFAGITKTGYSNDNLLEGFDGDDTLSGKEGNDTLVGNGGDDTLLGDAGDDTMVGGAGDDVYAVDSLNDVVIEQPDEGEDTVVSEIDYTLGENVENLSLGGMARTGTGNALDNVITGNDQSHRLYGKEGNDTLNGGSGNNVLLGGSGNDVLNAGSGTQILRGGSGADHLNGGDNSEAFYGGGGKDRIYAGKGDDFIEAGSGKDVIHAAAGNDQLQGGEGNDRLYAGSGADLLTGGTGNDILNGGRGSDRYLFSRGDGQDKLIDADDSGKTDYLKFAADVSHQQLWFARSADDLIVQIIGTADQVSIDDWYVSDNNQVEVIQAGDGLALSNTQIDQLVQSMAAFSPPASGELDLSAGMQAQLEPVLAASWQ